MDNHVFFEGRNIRWGGDSVKPAKTATVQVSGEKETDLNEALVQNPGSTYVMRVHTEVLETMGIRSGDMVIVDRAIEPLNGQIIIAELAGELLIRRFEFSNGKVHLLSSGGLAPIVLENFFLCQVWGVVTYVIHPV